MQKVRFEKVRVYGALHYTNPKRCNREIKCKLRLTLSPALYKQFSRVLNEEYNRLIRLPGYDLHRGDNMPVKRLPDGNYRLAVRSGGRNKSYTVKQAEEIENAKRINCTVRVYAYADEKGQGVKVRLVDYEILERGKPASAIERNE